MPPSREFTFVIDEDVKASLERHLRLKGPVRVKMRRAPSGVRRGYIEPASRLIVLELGFGDYEASRLTLVNNQVRLTLLHEYRHMYQYDHWPEEKLRRDHDRAYHNREVEEDANEWAAENLTRWGSLGRVSVRGGGSTLNRLARAERRVRA